MQRRGTMYNPLVVDTFVGRLLELEESTEDLGPVHPTLVQIAELNAPLVATTAVPARVSVRSLRPENINGTGTPWSNQRRPGVCVLFG